eukprot:scaffold8780_cov130-Isochrysis_galbana.AAC.12
MRPSIEASSCPMRPSIEASSCPMRPSIEASSCPMRPSTVARARSAAQSLGWSCMPDGSAGPLWEGTGTLGTDS